MVQYLFVGSSFLTHHSGADLAHAHAVPPAGTGKHEASGDTVANVLPVDDECRAVKVSG